MKRADVIARLAEVVVDLDAISAPTEPVAELAALCESARLAFGAAAVSVASLADDVLTYRAAAGEGAGAIVGVTLPTTRGIAGYVAMTGQAMAIDRATDDPRFARDVAERTGYVPNSLLVVPIDGVDGVVAGVLSVLDRTIATVDALALASSFAALAAPRLLALSSVTTTARVMLAGVVDAAGAIDADLAAALRRATQTLPEPDRQLADIAASLAGLRRLDDVTRTATTSIIGQVIELAMGRRRVR